MASGTDWAKVLPVPARPGNSVTHLIDGPETFRAMHQAILTAIGPPANPGFFIYLLGWWLDDDVPLDSGAASTITELFKSATRNKVQIRVMLWDQVGRKNTQEIERVNKLPTGAGILDNHTAAAGSHHQKVLLVNGAQGLIAFCGSVDINRDRIEAIQGRPGTPQHEVHCKITGPAAADLMDVFAQRWQTHPDSSDIDHRKGPLVGLNARAQRGDGNAKAGTQNVAIARTFNSTEFGLACAKDRSVRATMLAAIRAARRFIYIEDQYLVSMEAAAALRNALPRVQHVTIVIPSSTISDLPRVWEKRKEFLRVLGSGPGAASKVNVFYRVMYQRPASDELGRATYGAPFFGARTYIHAKTWIFDDELAVIGSANCNNRGWTYDSEVIAAIFDKPRSAKDLSFAQRLRMDLWAATYGLTDQQKLTLSDGVESLQRWIGLAAGRDKTGEPTLHRYDPDGGKDHGASSHLPWTTVDPDGSNLPACHSGPNTLLHYH